MVTSVLRRILLVLLFAIAVQVVCGAGITLFFGGQLHYGSVDTVSQFVVGEARAEAEYFSNAPPRQTKTKSFTNNDPCRTLSGAACEPLPVQVARSATSSPDVQALETDLRSTRQRLDEANRDKAAMSQSLQTMQAAVAEALKATKRTDDEKAANQALETDLRAMRKRLEDAGRDKSAMSQTLQAMQAAVAEALEATKRTDDEKAATQALEAHLRSTRQRLEEVGRDKAAMTQSLQALQATVADRDSKLRTAETQAAGLVANLAAAKRDAATTSVATKQSDDGKSATQALEADLRATRQRLEEAGRAKAAADQSLRAMQAAVVDREGKLKAAEAQTAGLVASLAVAKRDAAATSESMKRSNDEKAAALQSQRAMQTAVADREGKLKAAEARSANLVANLAAAKREATAASEAIKRSGDEKTAALQSLRGMQAAVADREGSFKAAEAQTAGLVAKLEIAKRDATVASEAAKRFGDDKAAMQTLEADLRSTRQRLEDAGHDKVAADQSLRALQAAAAERESKLKAAEAQTAGLLASLAAAKRDTAATKPSEEGKTTNQALEAELRATRQRLEDAGREKESAAQSMQAMQAGVADRESRLKAAEAQTAGLVASLDTAKRDAVAASEATKRSGDEKAANQALQADLRATRQRLEDAGRDKAAADRSLRTMQAGVADRDSKLEAAEARTAGLVASLAVAKRDAAVASAATKESDDGKAATQALQADLRATRQRLEDAGRDRAAADQSLRAMQAGVADRDNKLKAAEARTAILAASLATAKRDAAAATEASKRTADDRTTTQALQADLRTTRQRLEDAARDNAASVQSLHAMQAAAADRESKLKAAEARSIDLVASLAAAKHDAAATSEATKRAADERTANQALQADLSATRQQLENAGRDKATAAQSLRAMQAAVAEREGKLVAAEARSAALVASLATAKHDAAATSEAMKRTGPAEAAVESPGRGPSEAGTPPPTASNTQFPSDAAPSNVVLQYRAGNQVARQKATFLKSILDQSGIYSTNGPGAPNASPGVHVTYYYKQDKTLAKQVSKSLTSSEPTQKRATRDQMPLPGTVEVSIGG